MSETILHGKSCDCTLHDIGLNCRRALTPEALRREIEDLVSVALRSGFKSADVVQAIMLAVEWHRGPEVK